MRDPAGELADRLHLLRLPELRLAVAERRHIAHGATDDRARPLHEHAGVERHLDDRLVFVPVAAVELQRPLAVGQLPDGGVDAVARVAVEVIQREPRGFFGAVPEQRTERGVALDQLLGRGVGQEDALRTIDDRAIALLVVVQRVVQRRRALGQRLARPATADDGKRHRYQAQHTASKKGGHDMRGCHPVGEGHDRQPLHDEHAGEQASRLREHVAVGQMQSRGHVFRISKDMAAVVSEDDRRYVTGNKGQTPRDGRSGPARLCAV